MYRYISDLHFCHDYVIKRDARPYRTVREMNDDLIARWNDAVSNNDTVYILGDLCFRQDREAVMTISALTGRKVLILGNHDSVSRPQYRSLFNSVEKYLEIRDSGYNVILSHYPVAHWHGQDGLKCDGKPFKVPYVHLYGHLHNSVYESRYQSYVGGKAYNVGCMMPYMDYTPKTLMEIMEGRNDR